MPRSTHTRMPEPGGRPASASVEQAGGQAAAPDAGRAGTPAGRADERSAHEPAEPAAAQWALRKRAEAGPHESADRDSARIWWSETGVHQNLTFPVQPDPISGMHCWHQAVTVGPARPGDAHGDVVADTGLARAAYRRWMERTRPAGTVSPDGRRRPVWLIRPLRPSETAFALPAGRPVGQDGS